MSRPSALPTRLQASTTVTYAISCSQTIRVSLVTKRDPEAYRANDRVVKNAWAANRDIVSHDLTISNHNKS
jgi:hypothetical protein